MTGSKVIYQWKKESAVMYTFSAILSCPHSEYHPIIVSFNVKFLKNYIITSCQQGFHFLLCCLFPSLSLWVFSTGLISCRLWLPWKRWQTGRLPLKQQRVFLFSHQDATGMQATRLSQHWALSSAQRNGPSVCMQECVSGSVWVGVCAVHAAGKRRGVIKTIAREGECVWSRNRRQLGFSVGLWPYIR